MRSYFTRLAKQSGVTVFASNADGSIRAGARVPPDGAHAALHVEKVSLVDPMVALAETAAHNHLVESSTRSAPENIVSATREHQVPGESKHLARVAAPSAATSSTVTSTGNSQSSGPPEMSFFGLGSTFSHELPTGRGEPNVAGPESTSLERHSSGKGGVVRIGEQVSASERKPVPQLESNTQVDRAFGGSEVSIPSDFLEGIREWLEAPPITNKTELNRSATDLDPANHSLPAPFVDADSATQNDIQEFNLSIGNISIVVEEPARPPMPQSIPVQPAVERTPAGGRSGTRDAFALSRSYFRGF